MKKPSGCEIILVDVAMSSVCALFFGGLAWLAIQKPIWPSVIAIFTFIACMVILLLVQGGTQRQVGE